MIRAVADTHTIIWYLYNDARLAPAARASIEDAAAAGEQIALSSITLAGEMGKQAVGFYSHSPLQGKLSSLWIRGKLMTVHSR